MWHSPADSDLWAVHTTYGAERREDPPSVNVVIVYNEFDYNGSM